MSTKIFLELLALVDNRKEDRSIAYLDGKIVASEG